MMYFFNMRSVYYYLVKFQIKTLPMHGEMEKNKLY